MTDHATFWSEQRWTREYGYRPPAGFYNPYTLGYHIAQDIGGLYWTGPIPVLRAGVIVDVGRSRKIGGYIVVRADADGLRDSYTHLYDAVMPRAGTRVGAGDPFPRLARSQRASDGHEYMGSASSGPHLHFGVATTTTNVWAPMRGVDRDPRPIIRAALAATAGGNSRPMEEDDMPTADEIAKAVWNYKLENRTAGQRLRELAADVWAHTIGSKTDKNRDHGKAGDLVALGTSRSGRAASRAASTLDEISNLAPGQAPTSAQLEELADELRATLPSATAAELAKRLTS